MLSRQECIDKILANAKTIIEEFDVRSLRLFGSLARNQQHESSDVDVFVEMEPSIYKIIGLQEYLESLLGCHVDLIRKHRNNDAFLLKQIEKDGIDIIRESASNMAYSQSAELAINRLQERTKNILSVDDFLTSPVGMEKLDAACMVLIAIGESIKNLDKVSEGKLLPTYPSIPWKRVMGIRDIMAHHYFEVDADVVYEVVKKELEPLKQAIAFFKDQLFEEENKQ